MTDFEIGLAIGHRRGKMRPEVMADIRANAKALLSMWHSLNDRPGLAPHETLSCAFAAVESGAQLGKENEWQAAEKAAGAAYLEDLARNLDKPQETLKSMRFWYGYLEGAVGNRFFYDHSG